ncbi:uncharacterized protein LOC129764635 [Toxorhynchites rutilus septentrionalis]|uniref:uncharacterized protein LOC129764635 n=1 Tax=Toxorhynchites rutilus septentrionalis TaxID=329112 RepID=UPI002479F3BB|nr:uncharacterized protein LOC129764635 [Toxorhynchites rutilus septentrionalis]
MELYIRLSILFTVVAAFDRLLHGEPGVVQIWPNKSHFTTHHHDDGHFGSNQAALGGLRLRKSGRVDSISNVGDETAFNLVHGSYSYLDEYGVPVTVRYTVDEKSYGPHLPTVESASGGGGGPWHHDHVPDSDGR